MTQQLITPNPNIPCKPGWCLAYVNEAFRVRKVFGTATAAWVSSASKHTDYNFPSGVWFPVWFALAGEPAGHVALRAPDGSVYSTTDLSTTPRRHPDLADLMRIYAGAGVPLTYRGWTDDVEGTPVIGPTDSLSYSGETITPTISTTESEEDFMAGTIDAEQAEAIAQRAADLVVAALNGRVLINPVQAESIVQATTERTAAVVDAQASGKQIDRQQADDIARAAAQYNQERDAALYGPGAK